MSIATAGAFAIGEYPEGVAVMLFYAVGEVFQTLAVKRAKANIKTLLDQRPDEVTVLENNQPKLINARRCKYWLHYTVEVRRKIRFGWRVDFEKHHSIPQHSQAKANPTPKLKVKPCWQV